MLRQQLKGKQVEWTAKKEKDNIPLGSRKHFSLFS
jgi:hypothetical protein